MTFVTLLRLSPYYVCHLITFFAYNVCRIKMFVAVSKNLINKCDKLSPLYRINDVEAGGVDGYEDLRILVDDERAQGLGRALYLSSKIQFFL